MDAQQLLKQLDSDGIENLWVIYHDYSGRAAGKTVPPESFASVIENGLSFTPANLTVTTRDHFPPGQPWDAHTPDFKGIPDPDTYAVVPYLPQTARTHVYMHRDGVRWDGCPRSRLQRMIDIYAEEGLNVMAGFEAECHLYNKVSEGEYEPANQAGLFSIAGLEIEYDLWRNAIHTLRAMGVGVTQACKEGGPAQYELNLRHADAMRSVDDYLTMKEVIRAMAREASVIVTFMPKPYAHLFGNGLHIHLSLWDLEGKKEVSMGERDDEPLSAVGRHFCAGLMAHAKALTGIGAPIVNSYKRMLPGSWAPAHIVWGVSNRAALVRVPEMGAGRHLEFRSGDNACNPFMFLTALLAAGMDGIRNQMEPPAPIDFDVGLISSQEAAERGIEFLPRTLGEALDALEADDVIMEEVGQTIMEVFLNVKRHELQEFNLHVHPFERSYYLETI